MLGAKLGPGLAGLGLGVAVVVNHHTSQHSTAVAAGRRSLESELDLLSQSAQDPLRPCTVFDSGLAVWSPVAEVQSLESRQLLLMVHTVCMLPNLSIPRDFSSCVLEFLFSLDCECSSESSQHFPPL